MADEPFDLEPIDATFGAVVTGVELRSIDDAAFDALHEVWLEYALLIFPGQFLTRAEQDAFALRFGPLEFTAVPFSNVDADGTILSDPNHDVVKSLRGNEGWHHDSTYMPLQAKGSVFTAEVVTSRGGATGWADMRAAYEALDPDTQQRLSAMRAYHSLYYSQGRSGYMPTRTEGGGYDMYGFHDLEPSLRPLVKVHPETGRPNLLIGRHAYGIVGMSGSESEAFLDELNAEACQPPRIHHHQWSAGDAALWDNRRLMHRGTPFDMTEPRVMWHTRIAGDPASELADNHLRSQQRSGADVMGEDTLIVG